MLSELLCLIKIHNVFLPFKCKSEKPKTIFSVITIPYYTNLSIKLFLFNPINKYNLTFRDI